MSLVSAPFSREGCVVGRVVNETGSKRRLVLGPHTCRIIYPSDLGVRSNEASWKAYYVLGREGINASRARGGRARASVNFRKFSPCIARARLARGSDSLPSLSGVGNLSFQ
jgi:hypothetical protein